MHSQVCGLKVVNIQYSQIHVQNCKCDEVLLQIYSTCGSLLESAY